MLIVRATRTSPLSENT